MFVLSQWGISHRELSWVNVEESAKERRDFLWQTTNVDRNQGRKRQNMVARLYAKSMARNFTQRLEKRVAKPSKRNGGHSSTPKLAKRAASLPSVNKVQHFILRLARKAASEAVSPLHQRNSKRSKMKERTSGFVRCSLLHFRPLVYYCKNGGASTTSSISSMYCLFCGSWRRPILRMPRRSSRLRCCRPGRPGERGGVGCAAGTAEGV